MWCLACAYLRYDIFFLNRYLHVNSETNFIFTRALNVDFKGDFGYKEYHVRRHDRRTCAAHCLDQSRCKAYQYSAAYHDILGHGNCLLFDHQNINGRLYRDAHVYLKVEDMIPRATYTDALRVSFENTVGYADYRVGLRSQWACVSHCSSQSRCHAYEYSATNGICTLFSNQDATGSLIDDRYIYLKVKAGSSTCTDARNLTHTQHK